MDKFDLYYTGEKYYTKNDFKTAIKYFKKAVLKDPNFTDALHMTGVCYERLNIYDLALNYYLRNISIDENYIYSHYGAGNMLYRLKRYNEAHKYFKNCIDLDNKFAIGYDSLALTLEKLGKYNEALESIKKAIELEGSKEEFISHMKSLGKYKGDIFKLHQEGFWLFKEKKYLEALSKYQLITLIDPNNIEGWHMRALQHEYLRNYVEAKYNYERAINIDPDFFQSWIGLGNMNLILRNWDDALKSYERAIILMGKNDLIKNNIQLIENKINTLKNKKERKFSIYLNFETLDWNYFQINKLIENLKKLKFINEIYYPQQEDIENELYENFNNDKDYNELFEEFYGLVKNLMDLTNSTKNINKIIKNESEDGEDIENDNNANLEEYQENANSNKNKDDEDQKVFDNITSKSDEDENYDAEDNDENYDAEDDDDENNYQNILNNAGYNDNIYLDDENNEDVEENENSEKDEQVIDILIEKDSSRENFQFRKNNKKRFSKLNSKKNNKLSQNLDNIFNEREKSINSIMNYFDQKIREFDLMIVFCSYISSLDSIVKQQLFAAKDAGRPIIYIYDKVSHLPVMFAILDGLQFKINEFSNQNEFDEFFNNLTSLIKLKLNI